VLKLGTRARMKETADFIDGGSRECPEIGQGIGAGLVEVQDEELAVWNGRAAGGGLGFFHGFLFGEEMREFLVTKPVKKRFTRRNHVEVDVGIILWVTPLITAVAFDPYRASGAPTQSVSPLIRERALSRCAAGARVERR